MITDDSKTLLDTTINNCNCSSTLHSGALPCPVADHELITAIIDILKPKRVPSFKTVRDLRNYSPEMFLEVDNERKS